jgi:hypothetical protein
MVTFLLTKIYLNKKGFNNDFISIVYPFIPIANIGWSLGILVSILIYDKGDNQNEKS